ncbi:MAG TPA: NAD(P)/FAD-dependent oxidoreductase [Streptosporangiaceae bacterium]|nr:NAD(P)/FAD-dependent oxidoreductase [Streptosporangiaceae bacterium]
MDASFIRRALDQADLNALRMALYQETRDPELAEMKVVRIPVRGGATTAVRLDPECYERLKEKALAFLEAREADPAPTIAPPPQGADERAMMEMLVGEPLADVDYDYQRNFLSFAEFPFAATWTDGKPDIPPGFFVAIVGAGFSGIAIAVQLQTLGIPYRVYERRHEIGGVWSINVYPDARVDTASFTYQYSFEKNYPWSEYFARQHEVRGYLENVAKKYGVYDNICFDSDVSDAEFDESRSRWHLTITHSDGEQETADPNAVVSGAGLFSTPRPLDVEGVEQFTGRIVHTTGWAPEDDVRGKRVAVVGNGSTGVQVLARVAEDAEFTYVCQRTPQWISPRENYGVPISPESRWLFDTMPNYWNWYCYSMVAMGVGTQVLQEQDPDYQAENGGGINAKNQLFRDSLVDYIKSKVGSRPDLLDKLVPDYPPMARRLIVDNNWYTSLLRDDVELVTGPIQRITPTGFVGADGVERQVDVIVTATGFSVTKYLWPTEYRGIGGVKLEETWDTGDGPMAYLGMTVPKFPNMFILYGPNSQPRANSIPSWIELWSSYTAQCLVMLLEGGYDRITVRQDVFDKYNADLDAAARKLVWDEPASRAINYYVNPSGRQQVNAPWKVEQYYQLLKHPKAEDFDLERATTTGRQSDAHR